MTIHIKNLHPNTSERGVEKIFRKYGKVNSIVLALETKLGARRTYGYVEMENSIHALNAILGLNGSRQKRLTISVTPATVLKKSTPHS